MTEFFVILYHNPENQNLVKMKTRCEVVIILHEYTKNHDHTLYIIHYVPEVRCVTDAIVIFHFRLFFAITLLIPEISSFYTSVPKIMIIDHMIYCSWGMACDTCNCYFLIWAIFCNNPKYQNLKKNKMPRDIIIIHMCTKNVVKFLRYGAW